MILTKINTTGFEGVASNFYFIFFSFYKLLYSQKCDCYFEVLVKPHKSITYNYLIYVLHLSSCLLKPHKSFK